jgi:hypothetical protein
MVATVLKVLPVLLLLGQVHKTWYNSKVLVNNCRIFVALGFVVQSPYLGDQNVVNNKTTICNAPKFFENF